MELHVRNVGWALILLGIGMAVLALVVLLAAGGFSGLLLTDDPFYKRNDIASIPLVRLLAVLYVVFSLVVAVPTALAGRGILAWQQWAKTLGMLMAAVNMLSFPLGTGIGLYSLWVLTDETTEFLFANSPTSGTRR